MQVITDLEDLPLDPVVEGEDGDDALLADGEVSDDGVNHLPLAPVRVMAEADAHAALVRPRLVPFVRELRKGSHGWDVVGLKRAVSRADPHVYRWQTFTPLFGPKLKAALQTFQQRHGLTADGVYGPATHAKLAPSFDSRAIWLLHKQQLVRPDRRMMMRGAAILTYNNAWDVHYTQGPLRMSGVKGHLRPPRYGRYEDCSSEATWLAYVAGVPDPNDLHYSGYGYTGTIAANCTRVLGPKVGTYALYGHGFPYHHVATCIGFQHGTPIVHSHGSESGPKIVSAYYRGDLHGWYDPLGGK